MSLVSAESDVSGKAPVMVCIWFVDVPGLFRRLLSAITIAGGHQVDARMIGIYPIPVRQFVWVGTTYSDLSQHREAKRWFLMAPGVWAEMSNGDHRPIATDTPGALADIARAVVAARKMAFGA